MTSAASAAAPPPDLLDDALALIPDAVAPDAVYDDAGAFPIEIVDLRSLREHPRNYRKHPADQIAHLKQSYLEHGWYKNIVLARDGTILAGHGIRLGALAAGATHGPARRLPLRPDEPRALKVLAADNELSHLAEDDDRMLSEILRDVMTLGDDPDHSLNLLGTGFDALALSALVMVSRPKSEIADHNEAAHWVGLPECESKVEARKVIVSFRDDADFYEFARVLGLRFTDKTKSTWWPLREQEDSSSLRFVDAPPAAPDADSDPDQSIPRAPQPLAEHEAADDE